MSGFEVENETVVISKYGMRTEMQFSKETRSKLERFYLLEDGTKLDAAGVARLKEEGKVGEGAIARVLWEETEDVIVGLQPELCTLYDSERWQAGISVFLFGTTDGPIISCVKNNEGRGDADWVTFWDPAHVQYSANGQINLVPIFGVTRKMEMHVTSVKQRAVPSEVIAEVYMQFVMQNRQFAYELRPRKPMAATPELVNDEPAPSVKTQVVR